MTRSSGARSHKILYAMMIAASIISPEPGLIFWLSITFLIVLFILRRYACGPIIQSLETREKTIESSIQRAENALSEARQMQEDNERARRESEQDAQLILREARETAEKLRDEEVDQTRTQIRLMQEQAQAEIEREKDQALNTLRAEVADLAVEAAGIILKENLDANRQRKLVDDFIDSLSKN